MKSVLISIRPQWCEKIASGKKTIEVRKSAPKEVPFKAYIYCTRIIDKKHCRDEFDIGIWKGSEHVIGEFICDKVSTYPRNYKFGYEISENEFNETALTAEQFVDYGNGGTLYGWRISNLKIYDKPKELSEFYRPCSYSGICYSCNRFRPNGTPNDEPNDFCDGEIIRPPQSYMYVKEVGTKQQ